MPERYSKTNDVGAFGFLANAMERRPDEDGDRGAFFPRSDAEDMSRGARFIPDEVTLDRRAGKKVEFITNCEPCCWYWQMPDGSRIYHFDPLVYSQIARHNGKHFKDERPAELAGPCPTCGNAHTNGGKIQAGEIPA